MPIPRAVTTFNKRVLNPVLIKFAGKGWFAEVEHVGRKSGRVYHNPILAFTDDDVVTVALTYGPKVDWLANLKAARGGHMVLGGHRLTLGPPKRISTDDGLARMPKGPKQLLPVLGCRDFVEFPILRSEPAD